MARTTLIAALFVALVVGTLASEFESPEIAHLTSSNYDDKISDGKVYFIKYYAPWCGHCKRLAPAWKELAAELKSSHPNIAIGHIDCTSARDVCQTAGIKGYPTLKVMHKGEEIKKYAGPRDKDSLKTFIVDTAASLTTESA